MEEGTSHAVAEPRMEESPQRQTGLEEEEEEHIQKQTDPEEEKEVQEVQDAVNHHGDADHHGEADPHPEGDREADHHGSEAAAGDDQLACGAGAGQGKRDDGPDEDTVELGGDKFSIKYDRHCGPARAGRILLALKGPDPPIGHDVGELLDSLGDLVKSQRFRSSEGMVGVIDIRLLVWPSVFCIPDLVGILRERSLPAAIRDHTIGIAIVHADSAWLGWSIASLVSMVSHILGAEIVPVCASTCEGADELLRETLDNRIAA